MFIKIWHNFLDMKRFDCDWHVKDVEEEYKEYEEAVGFFHSWSELSDVVYTYTRGKYYDDCKNLKNPFGKLKTFLGSIYMYPKYTLRWSFYRFVGKKFNKKLSEVRNFKKEWKLDTIAERSNISPEEFKKVVKKYQKRWLFLP